VKSSKVGCDQVDSGRLGVDFSLKSGHVSDSQVYSAAAMQLHQTKTTSDYHANGLLSDYIGRTNGLGLGLG